jgi:hypothetical protein
MCEGITGFSWVRLGNTGGFFQDIYSRDFRDKRIRALHKDAL